MSDLDEGALEAAVAAWREAERERMFAKGPLKPVDVCVAAAITAYLAKAGDGWLPIESAPRDGAHFLAYEPTGDMYRAAYHSEGYLVAFCGQYVTAPLEPTHWRPIPKEPTNV